MAQGHKRATVNAIVWSSHLSKLNIKYFNFLTLVTSEVTSEIRRKVNLLSINLSYRMFIFLLNL